MLSWLATARDCFSDEYGSLERGFLTSVFALIVGLERIFHLDQMQDAGFALLTGGARRCPSRHVVGAWRRHVRWNEVDRFCHRTSPWELLHREDLMVSFDEHTIPRWTKKFLISKGYVTTRNKYMRCEKVFLGYEVNLGRFVTIKGTPGKVELRDVAGLLTRRVLRHGQSASLHAVFDAGAGKSDANVRALMDQAEATPNLEVTLRACRYPHRVEQWKQLPAEAFTTYEEPGVCQGAPPKEIRVAETRTVLKGESPQEAVRTIVCRQVIRGPKKDRWHPLYTSSEVEAGEVLDEFRLRQHHEQAFRVQVHDEFLNAVPCGYDKESPDRRRPRFHRGPLQLMGWLVALVYNACADFAEDVSAAYAGKFIRTLRRTFFERKGDLYCTPKTLIVYLEEFPEQDLLIDYIDQFNASQHRVPWLDNRQLVLSLSPHPPRAGPLTSLS
ncbi:MAG: hypothetical protein ABIK89_25660 [Planctomycetota bacterium]